MPASVATSGTTRMAVLAAAVARGSMVAATRPPRAAAPPGRANVATLPAISPTVAAPTNAAMLSFLHSRVVDRDGRLLLMPLRLFYDAHVLDQRYGPLIDWRRNLDLASRVGVAAPCGAISMRCARSLASRPTAAHRLGTLLTSRCARLRLLGQCLQTLRDG
jgi:hypothetical protein